MPHFESDEDFFNALDNGPEATGFKHSKRQKTAAPEKDSQDDENVDCDEDQ